MVGNPSAADCHYNLLRRLQPIYTSWRRRPITVIDILLTWYATDTTPSSSQLKNTEYCTAEGEISDNEPPQITTHSFRILNTAHHLKLWVIFPSMQLKRWLANSSMDRSLNISRSPYIRIRCPDINVLQGIHIFETSLQNNAKEDFQCLILVKLSIKSSSCPF